MKNENEIHSKFLLSKNNPAKIHSLNATLCQDDIVDAKNLLEKSILT